MGGKWTAIIFLRDGTLNNPGTVNWQFTTQDFGAVDSVVPSAQTIAPGKTKTFQYDVECRALPAISHDLVISGTSDRTIVPVSCGRSSTLSKNGGTSPET